MVGEVENEVQVVLEVNSANGGGEHLQNARRSRSKLLFSLASQVEVATCKVAAYGCRARIARPSLNSGDTQISKDQTANTLLSAFHNIYIYTYWNQQNANFTLSLFGELMLINNSTNVICILVDDHWAAIEIRRVADGAHLTFAPATPPNCCNLRHRPAVGYCSTPIDHL